MFGQKTDARKPARMETIIGAGSSFQGTFRCEGLVRVDGRLEGGVSASGVVVGETGEVRGDVSARTVIIDGKVRGNIHASESLELLPRAHVFGDLVSPQLTVAEGAIFEGNCMMSADKSKVIEVNANG